ncbi:MAG: PAS domain S-box protein [Candidatus Omnitrophica bacterium]|nr:PAS domain S-box protein [Candidatus Omnitrophota bacterium]
MSLNEDPRNSDAILNSLQEELSRYELAIDGTTHGIWDWKINPDRWDAADSEVQFSSKLLETLGYQKDELKNTFEALQATLHPVDQGNVMKAIENHLLRKEPFNVDSRICFKNGEYHWFRIRGQAVWDEQGRPVRMAAFLVDIQWLKKAEHEFLIAEEKYRTVFENSAVAITVTDEHERLVSWNKFTENLLGMTHDDLYLKPIQSFYPEDEWRKIRAYNIREKGMQHHLETKMIKKNGELIDIDVSLSVLKDPEGQITGAIGISRDITERKQAEVMMRKLSSVVERTGDSVMITDVNGIIEYVNPAFEQNTGYKKEEVTGKTPRVIKSGQHDQKFYEVLWATILSGQVFRATVINKKKNGELTYEEQVITPLVDKENKITHFVSTARDITFRKQAEEALKKAKEAAEAANRAKSEFLANMSHEIRTPMNGVIGMAGLLLDTELTPEQHEYAEGVRSSADNLLTLINDILDFSKIEAGKLNVEPIPFDLHLAVEEVADMLAVKAQEKGIELIVRCDPEAPRRVIGDVGRIRQILTNLVGNAVKFTDEGHVLINVDCKSKNAEFAEFKFSVEDTGIGIADDHMRNIFDKFTQADASTTRRYGGTGLGLAICKQLVDLMSGEIGVKSLLGRGSAFWFQLRLPLDHQGPQQIPLADLAGIRIMIVDDNPINRRVLTEQIMSWGGVVDAFATPAEALAGLQNAHNQGKYYQIGLLDFQLPGMDGEMLARAIKSDSNLKDIVLILITSMGMRGDAQRLTDLGVAAYLVKPIRQDHLKETLAMVWGAKSKGISIKLITRHTLKEAKVSDSESKTPERTARGAAVSRILLAEDNAVSQQVARRMLEKLGCRVDVVGNGSEAVRMARELPYDLVFMDCQMPEMDGYEATRQIRKHEGTQRHTTIVALTAHALEGEREKCLDAGMDDYLTKPVTKEDLLTVLKRWVHGGGAKQAGKGQDEIEIHDPATPAPKPQAPAEKAGTAPADQPGDASQKPAIDPQRIGALIEFTGDDDPFFIPNLFQTYFSNAEQRMAGILEALGAGDANRMRQEVHSLKGSSANVGAVILSELCKQLEMLGKSGTIEGALPIFEQIKVELKRVQEDFERNIKDRKFKA